MTREMKPSKVDFAPFIPFNWEQPMMKHHCKILNGSDPKTENGNIPVYGSGDEIVKYCEEFKKGPVILLGRKGTLDKPKLILGKFWNVDTALDLHPNKNINLLYLFYVTQILDIKKYSTSTVKPSMTQTDYYSMHIPYPPLSEQQAIANYLDDKCSKIDEAIFRHKAIVEKLKEYRKSVITEAVTHGLNPNVEMKPSMVDFAPFLPSNWKQPMMKHHCKILNGSDPKTENGGTPVYGSGDEIVKYCEEFKEGPVILLGRKGTLDKPKLILGKFWNVDTALDLHPYNNINLFYLFYVTQILDIKKYSTSTVKPSMTQTDYYSMHIPYPPLNEQQQIVDYLDNKCSKIDEAISRSNAIIEKLEEYKKSIIYEHVTGKKEVSHD